LSCTRSCYRSIYCMYRSDVLIILPLLKWSRPRPKLIFFSQIQFQICNVKCRTNPELGRQFKFICIIIYFLQNLIWTSTTWHQFCRRFDPGGSLDQRVNCRRVSQPRWVIARRSTKGEKRQRGNPRPSCCPAPRSGVLAVGGLQASAWERESLVRRPVLPRGQPSRTRALDLPFIGVRRGPRCTMGGVAVC
jgi:hypothetical protein